MSFTGNVTAILGSDIASVLGKKGTSSDVTLYNFKQGDCILSFVQPSSYPDKIQPLISSLTMADQVIFKIDELTPTIAETIMALDAFGLKNGYLIVEDLMLKERIKTLAKNSVVNSYQTLGLQPALVREKLSQFKMENNESPMVLVDHSFPVKGVGTVALGVVKTGLIRKHDNITIYPSKENTLVKSVQVHDTDVAEATSGVRVGLALKDIKPEDIPRGSILSVNDSLKTGNTLEIDFTLSQYSQRTINPGDVFLAGYQLTYTPATVMEGSLKQGQKGKIKIQLEKEIAILPEPLILLDPSQKIPRIMGGGKV